MLRITFKTAAGAMVGAVLSLAAWASAAMNAPTAISAPTSMNAPTAMDAPTAMNALAGERIDLAAVVGDSGLAGGHAPLVLPDPDRGASVDGRVAVSDFRPPAPARSPTSVDYSLAHGGPHGSLGYICQDGMAPIAPREAAVTAGTDGGRLIGGSFLIPIR